MLEEEGNVMLDMLPEGDGELRFDGGSWGLLLGDGLLCDMTERMSSESRKKVTLSIVLSGAVTW